MNEQNVLNARVLESFTECDIRTLFLDHDFHFHSVAKKKTKTKMLVADLKRELSLLGLSTVGSKDELTNRLKKAQTEASSLKYILPILSKSFIQLSKLDLSYRSELDDILIQFLAPLVNLCSLNLSNTSITNDGVHYLQSLNQLVELNLSATAIDDGVAKELKSFPLLTSLDLSSTWADVNSLIESLVATHKYLSILKLEETELEEEGLSFLKKLPLSILNVSETIASGLSSFEKLSTDLVELKINCGILTHINPSTNLQNLTITFSNGVPIPSLSDFVSHSLGSFPHVELRIQKEFRWNSIPEPLRRVQIINTKQEKVHFK